MKRTLCIIMVFCLVISAVLFAAGEAEKTKEEITEEPAVMEVKTLRLGGEPPTGTFRSVWIVPGAVHRILFKRLLSCDENLNPIYPSLVREWSVSDNGLEYTLTLRDDIEWHDGQPITIEDVKWSIETAIKAPRMYAFLKAAFESIEGAMEYKNNEAEDVNGLEVIDKRTLLISLSKPTAFFLYALAQFGPLPYHLLKDEDPAKIHLSEFWQWPIGSGPFKIVEREPGDYTILEPFDDYFGGKPKIDRVILRYWSDIVIACEDKQIDYGHTMDVSEAKQIMKMPYMKVTPFDIGYIRAIWINLARKLYDDVRIRRALIHALDRQSLVQDLYEGYGEVIPTYMIPEWQNKELEPYPYDPEKAKKLLKEANWPSDEVIDFAYFYTDQITTDLVAAIQYYWKQVGVKCEPRLLKGNLGEIIFGKKDFDLIYVGLATEEPHEAVERYTTDSSINAISYSNEKFDELVEKAATTPDRDMRKAIYDELQVIMYEDAMLIPLYSLKCFCYESKRINRPEIYPSPWYEAKLEWEDWVIK